MSSKQLTRTKTRLGMLVIQLVSPFLINLFPILSLYSNNVDQAPFSEAGRPILFSLVLTAVLFIIAAIIFRRLDKASITTALMGFAFLTYGQFYLAVKNISIGDVILGRHRYIAPLGLLFLGLVLYLIWRAKSLSNFSVPIFIFSLAMLAVPSAKIVIYQLQGNPSASPVALANNSVDSAAQDINPDYPDIYYIILDGYARADVLEKYYNFDNSDFVNFLETNGFYVAAESRANYTHTNASITSSLNMDYLTSFIPDLEVGEGPRIPTIYLSENLVRTFLAEHGYTSYSFPTGYNITEKFNADVYLTPEMPEFERLAEEGFLSPFEVMFLNSTGFKLMLDIDSIRNTPAIEFINDRFEDPIAAQAYTILSFFDHLQRIPSTDRPKLVFAHIVSPHPPYLFNADGEIRTNVGSASFANRDYPPDEVHDLYLDQLVFINHKVEEAISAILENSQRPVVIIIQADHGPILTPIFGLGTADSIFERAGILNAYRVSEECQDLLYPSISPVNSFRVIFNCYFGANFDLLEDRSYMMDYLEVPAGY